MTHSYHEHAADWQVLDSMGAFARFYAFLGFAVLPLERGGKRPHRVLGYEGGVHHGTRDPGLISRWWKDAPSANVGVACGMASGGLVVLDLDVKNGVSGHKSLFEETGRLGLSFPQQLAPMTSTPSGGSHIWMRWPWAGGVPSRQGMLAGVDVKGDGGYVVAPPSGLVMPRLEAGQESVERVVPYEWQHGCPCEMPEVTASLGEWMATAQAAGSYHQPQARTDPDGRVTVLAGTPAQAASELRPGMRNSALSARAASLFRRYGTGAQGMAQVTDDLRQLWEQMDNRDFPWQEVRVLIAHAQRFVQRKEEEEREWNREAEAGWLRDMRRRNGL